MSKNLYILAGAILLFSRSGFSSSINYDMAGNWALPEQCAIFDEIGVPDSGVSIGENEVAFYEEYCTLSEIVAKGDNSFSGKFRCVQEGASSIRRIDIFKTGDGKLSVSGLPVLDTCGAPPVVDAELDDFRPEDYVRKIKFKHEFMMDALGTSSVKWVGEHGYVFYEYIVKPSIGQKTISESRLKFSSIVLVGQEQGVDEDMDIKILLDKNDALVKKISSGEVYEMKWSGYFPADEASYRNLVGFVSTINWSSRN